MNFSSNLQDLHQAIKTVVSEENETYIIRKVDSRFSVYIFGPKKNHTTIEELKKIRAIDEVDFLDKNKDSFIWNDLQAGKKELEKGKNIFFIERHLTKNNWFVQRSEKVLNTPIISFYSFKGGVGRTTAMVMAAHILAQQGKKVALIDFDLEAPGLATLFALQKEEAKREEYLSVKGFVDFINDYNFSKKDLDQLSLDDYYFKHRSPSIRTGGELFIFPAISTGKNDSDLFIDKLSKVNLNYNKHNSFGVDTYLKLIEKEIQPDVILIDSRTGINDIGGLVFNRYAQMIFLLFYGNSQNMFGLRSIVPKLNGFKENEIPFYLINSPVPNPQQMLKLK